MPTALALTLDARTGVAEAARVLGADNVRRVVATGNGAAYYVALALSLAALESNDGPEIVAMPAGIVADPRFRWRSGDRLLAISSSGEFKDVVKAIDAGAPRPIVAITATATSTLAGLANVVVLQTVLHQRAITHTQALAGALALGLLIWAEVTSDRLLAAAAEAGPAALESAISTAPTWARAALDGVPYPSAGAAFGTGPAWAGALETALLLKEIARIPAEGVETREGATSVMYGLAPGHLVLALKTRDDPGLAEAVRLCQATGATVLEVPGGDLADRRFALATSLPATAATAALLAQQAGHDVDHPTWTDAYYSTARGTATEDET